MPSGVARLGHDQKLRIDGVAVEGTRDVEISVDTVSADVTGWNHQWASTLPLIVDVSVRCTIYWREDMARVWPKLNAHRPQKVTLVIDGVYTMPAVPTEVKIANPLNGVLAYDVTFKLWNYQ